ncbi:hypothetical protein TNCV_319721 [Trichonephila clavipes]|nr:hypothetical protein TNCV_319721 [Trichonephila clavipes]
MFGGSGGEGFTRISFPYVPDRLVWEGQAEDRFGGSRLEAESTNVLWMTTTVGSDVVQSGRQFSMTFFQHLWPYIGNNTANVIFQMVKRLWLIRIDQ